MDNAQFRTFLQSEQKSPNTNNAATAPAFKKPALGSRMRSSVPMTPRSVAGYNASRDLTRQVAEHGRSTDGQPPTKKFRSSAAPKGTKLAAGYNDRTVDRKTKGNDDSTQDDKETRLRALEEMYKLQQLDEATFEALKAEIGIGGSLGTTHLVKGLDWKLLERVRRGDDINAVPASGNSQDKVDLDDELDRALKQDVETKVPASSKATDRSQTDQSDASVPGTRDDILRRLKESRKANNVAEQSEKPSLGDKFKRVGADSKSNKKKFVETVNGRRREVLVITQKDGTTKRKTRWLDKEDTTPQQTSKPLGMEVPAEFLAKQQALQQQAAEDEDEDIFGGVAEYDPLAGLGGESDESDDEAQQLREIPSQTVSSEAFSEKKARNYFNTDEEDPESGGRANPITNDPTLVAALKRAAALRKREESDGEGHDSSSHTDPDREAKQKQFLARLREQDRADAADMDLGFGESRFGDDDEEEAGGWDGDAGEGKKAGRKRGPKKRKGDKDSVNDVMGVLEGRGKGIP